MQFMKHPDIAVCSRLVHRLTGQSILLLRRALPGQPARSLLRNGQPTRDSAQTGDQSRQSQDGLSQERGLKGKD